MKFQTFLTTCLLCVSFLARANYSLVNEQSSVNFLSTKNEHITEVHSFDKFSGTIDDQRQLALRIELASVNTLIPIRNERMQKMLFNIIDFPEATFTATLPVEAMNVTQGTPARFTITGDLTISGNTQQTTFSVLVNRLSENTLSATTTQPTILNAEQFGLDSGVNALREIAKLKSISKSVPLTFHVVFSK